MKERREVEKGRHGRPEETSGARPDATLDTVGLLCPAPIIKTAEKLRSMAPGEVLEILSDDPGMEADMPAWCEGSGHELIAMERRGREIRALVRKKREG